MSGALSGGHRYPQPIFNCGNYSVDALITRQQVAFISVAPQRSETFPSRRSAGHPVPRMQPPPALHLFTQIMGCFSNFHQWPQPVLPRTARRFEVSGELQKLGEKQKFRRDGLIYSGSEDPGAPLSSRPCSFGVASGEIPCDQCRDQPRLERARAGCSSRAECGVAPPG
jgi:hypothetical protein